MLPGRIDQRLSTFLISDSWQSYCQHINSIIKHSSRNDSSFYADLFIVKSLQHYPIDLSIQS
jgi:hypothetical protein